MTIPVLVLATDDIRKQLIRHMTSPQSKIMIVTPFLQDIELVAGRSLRGMLEAQIRALTEIELFTTPPQGGPSEFRRKYTLLQTYSTVGIKIYLSNKLHAKAFCFNNEGLQFVSLVGSANLTSKGLKDNLELAVFSARDQMYHSTMALIRIFLRDSTTEDFFTWKQRNVLNIKTTLGGNP